MQRQCKACPWRVDCEPTTDIPNGYSCDLHKGLANTISDGGLNLGGTLRIMACHESPLGKEKMCVGWLDNQLGAGNNIALRLMAIQGRTPKYELVGEQHRTFEDTLPGDDDAL